jgi:hypothetical protein
MYGSAAQKARLRRTGQERGGHSSLAESLSWGNAGQDLTEGRGGEAEFLRYFPAKRAQEFHTGHIRRATGRSAARGVRTTKCGPPGNKVSHRTRKVISGHGLTNGLSQG